jgi:hypothetical protein
MWYEVMVTQDIVRVNGLQYIIKQVGEIFSDLFYIGATYLVHKVNEAFCLGLADG